MALRLQFAALLRGAPVLPHDGVVDRFTGVFIQNEGGFTLVGHADGGNLCAFAFGLCYRLLAYRQRTGPDVFWVMLYPAVGRIMLCKFLLSNRDDLGIRAKNDGTT